MRLDVAFSARAGALSLIALLLAWSVVVSAQPARAQTPTTAATPPNAPAPAVALPTGDEIVRNCDSKYPGEDQKSELIITLKDQAGNERKNVYTRFWKDYKAVGNVVDKMVLFTTYPPDAEGAGFMRVAYTPESKRSADQLIYLPVLRKIRKVSVRDLSDSFLGSDLTYGDITPRRVEDDTHKLIRLDQDKRGLQYYVVESVPKEPDSIYSKKISWYTRAPNWDACFKVQVDYFDKRNSLLKRQGLIWQKVGPAWVWDKVFVENAQTFHSSHFEVKNVMINVDLKEDVFTERRLMQGIK